MSILQFKQKAFYFLLVGLQTFFTENLGTKGKIKIKIKYSIHLTFNKNGT